MDWHVIAHRNHSLFAVEQRARIVPPFLDIRRNGSPPQRGAHLFCDRVNAALKNRQRNRIAVVVDRLHQWTSITRLLSPSTRSTSPGGKTVAELYSEIMAGPANVSPGRSNRRPNIRVSWKAPSK